MDKIVVILSTYNGEKYLEEQIASILKQNEVEVKLLIRDDGSSDNTHNMLQDIRDRNPSVETLFQENVGCKKSFYLAAQYAFETFPDTDYYAFSDQDDFWLNDKLSSAIKTLMQNTEIGRGLPLLYFCPPKVVDERLQPMNVKWSVRHKLNFEEACLSQPCAGCTMVFNRRALELFLLGNPDKMSLHDSWMYKTVLACGGIVIEDNESHILYRQHGNNVVGTQTFTSRWKRRLNNFISKNRYRSNQVAEILSTYHDYMPSHNIDTAKTLSEYCNLDLVSRIKIALNKKYRTLNRINNFLFITAILFKRY